MGSGIAFQHRRFVLSRGDFAPQLMLPGKSNASNQSNPAHSAWQLPTWIVTTGARVQ
jgi:hypothetical protein